MRTGTLPFKQEKEINKGKRFGANQLDGI